MEWDETEASRCRYGEIAGKIWGDHEILFEKSEVSYSGYAAFIARKGRKYSFYEWSYGSCSGCDSWEAAEMTDEQIEQEMRNTAMWFNGKKQLLNWVSMMEKTVTSIFLPKTIEELKKLLTSH